MKHGTPDPSSLKAGTMPSFGFSWHSYRLADQTVLAKHPNVDKYVSESYNKYGSPDLSWWRLMYAFYMITLVFFFKHFLEI